MKAITITVIILGVITLASIVISIIFYEGNNIFLNIALISTLAANILILYRNKAAKKKEQEN